MKIRRGFVSNSSSSSFIVIGTEEKQSYTGYEYCVHDGVYEFGWGPEECFGITSRINWVMLLANTEEDFDLIEKVLALILKENQYKQGFDFFKDILQNKDGGFSTYDYAYIDHQSNEDTENLFKDLNKMKTFIFNDDSYIQIDNDNY